MIYAQAISIAKSVIDILWKCRTINDKEVTDEVRVGNSALLERWFFDITGCPLPNEERDGIAEYLLYRGLDKGYRSSYFTDEYPYQTDYQLRMAHSKETSLEFAQNHDTLSRSQSPKTRKKRLEVEEALNVKKWRLNEHEQSNKGI
ncbi:hypothetical protein [Staphylococcus felis]|uniref:hypothetical protein n=1 Tax=Staphylococcus felis TaxID=46127 RepID=UPI000CD2DA59|nr:hypothetical protein [Staphylococcus felis]AVP37441.1 hypothetical protein C7J90_10910 [Staphylococcus felis]PNZ36251.1 hypothetical protein CD143_04610 [Staphylococcus felis]QQB02611.1 hypothetical protein I6H71_07595 [Staphylococcus felis]